MSSVARRALLASVCLLILICPKVWAKDLHVLLLGDRMAANCQPISHSQGLGVAVLGSDGKERPVADSSVGEECEVDDAWMSLATRIKRQSGISKVVLVPVAIKGVKVGDWTANTAAARRLSNALSALLARGARIDYALWQQGFADGDTASEKYVSQVHTTIKRISSAVPVDKWLIATVGDCKSTNLEHIREAQRQLGKQSTLSRFPGPNVDFSLEGQASECMFSNREQEVIAQRWFEAIQHADILSRRSRLETLLYFFK